MARNSTKQVEHCAKEACEAVGLKFGLEFRDVTDGAWLDHDPGRGGWRLYHRYNGGGSIRVLNGGERMGSTVMLAFLSGMIVAADTLRGRT